MSWIKKTENKLGSILIEIEIDLYTKCIPSFVESNIKLNEA